MSGAHLSEVILRLYAAAAAPDLWPEALRAVEDLTGAVGAVVDFAPLAPGVPGFSLSGRFDPEQCATFASEYMPHCRRIKAAMAHPELDVLYDSLVMSEQEMDRDPVQDWLARQGIRYFIGANLMRTASHHVTFSLQRSAAAGHVQSADIELHARLRPHVVQAVTLAEALETLKGRQAFAAAVLDRLPHAVFALGETGRIIFSNRRGEDLRSREPLLFKNDQLKTIVQAESAALAEAIRAASRPGLAASGGGVRLSRRSSTLPLHLVVSHVGELMRAELNRGPVALVIVYDRLDRRSAEAAALQALFGLTPAEARLALALAGGHSVESAARLLDITPLTARTHLKAIFRKTEVSRQQDLAALILPLASAATA